MKILYAWDGSKPLPEKRLACVRQTMKVYPKADYHVITRAESFLPGFTVIGWDVVMTEIADWLGLKRMPYNWNNPVTFSDWARFWFLGRNKRMLYLDTDAQMERPYRFGASTVHSPRNICLLYSGDRGSQFLDLLRFQASRYIGQLMHLHGRLDSKSIHERYFTHAH